jgi:hypothetical protein
VWCLFGTFIGVLITLAILTFCEQHPARRPAAGRTDGSIGGVHARDIYAFRRKHANLPARAGGQGVNEKIGRRFVGSAHDRRRGRDDLGFAARADPIDMAVPCMTMALGATHLILRMNHEPLISAVPMRSDNFETDIGYSTR